MARGGEIIGQSLKKTNPHPFFFHYRLSLSLPPQLWPSATSPSTSALTVPP